MTTAETSRADQLIFATTLGLLVWLPMPWGSNRAWAVDFLTAASAALLGLRLLLVAGGWIRQPRETVRRLAAPAIWWALWLAWIGVQLLPVDAAELMRLSPESGRLYAEAAPLLSSAPQPRISIAPGATVDAWLLTGGYCALYFLVASACIDNRGRLLAVLGTLVVAGLFQAVYGSLMVLSGIEWGFLGDKQYYREVATGTFVNRNHLAGYLELTAAAAVGLILADIGTPRPWRGLRRYLLDLIALLFSAKVRARLALAIMVIGLVLTRSRMGNIAFFGALSACGMVFVLFRYRRYALRALALFASIVAVDILIVSNWYGLNRVLERIEATEIGAEPRAVFLNHVPPTIDAYRVAGSGLGTFEYAFAPYRTERMGEHFDHAHNDYIEFMIETGAIGIGLLGVFVLTHAVHAVLLIARRRRRLAAATGFAALMGMGAIAIHSIADFNLQIPANAATLLALMALAASCSASPSAKSKPGMAPDDAPAKMA